MFRYLWKFKALSAGLIAGFAGGFYLYPTYAWAALVALTFLRVTKLHSYLVMVDLTDRAATKHVRALAIGRRKVDHLLTADTKQQLKRLRKRINRIIDQYQVASQSEANEEYLQSGREYEIYCKRILEEAGWSVVLTPGSGDQGADIIVENNDIRVVVQCKFYNSPVGNKAVQEAYAAAGFQDAHFAAVVTNSIFTKSARQLAHKNNVVLMHHEDLAGLEDVLAELEPSIR